MISNAIGGFLKIFKMLWSNLSKSPGYARLPLESSSTSHSGTTLTPQLYMKFMKWINHSWVCNSFWWSFRWSQLRLHILKMNIVTLARCFFFQNHENGSKNLFQRAILCSHKKKLLVLYQNVHIVSPGLCLPSFLAVWDFKISWFCPMWSRCEEGRDESWISKGEVQTHRHEVCWSMSH